MAEGVRIIIRNAADVQARVGQLPVQATAALRKALSRSLDIVYRRIAANLTGRMLKVDTGRLRQSIQYSMEIANLRGRIGTNVEYAAIHEYGGQTRPHKISAVHAGSLRFVNPGFVGPLRLTKKGKIAKRQTAGSLVFTQSVNHPGSTMPARPYMRPALAESREEIVALMRQGLIAALKAKA
jgi:phage gpG-like protein